MEIHTDLVKQGILLLWALWLSLVVLLNSFDVLKSVGILPPSWRFHSHNFDALIKATRTYDTPIPVVWVLYLGAIALEVLCAGLLWRSVLDFSLPNATAALASGLLLWGLFILANEAFLTFLAESAGAYSVAATHRSLFVAFLVSLIAMHAIP